MDGLAHLVLPNKRSSWERNGRHERLSSSISRSKVVISGFMVGYFVLGHENHETVEAHIKELSLVRLYRVGLG